MSSDAGRALEETPWLFLEWLCMGTSAESNQPCAKPVLHTGTGSNDALSLEMHAARTWVRATKATWVQEGQGRGLCGHRAACCKPRAPVRTGWESHCPHRLLFRATRGTFSHCHLPERSVGCIYRLSHRP